MDPLTIIERYGIALTILFGLGWFLKRDLWPFAREEIRQYRIDRTAERAAQTATITSLTTIATEAHAKHSALLQTMTVQIEALAHAQLETVQTIKTLREEQMLILAYLRNKTPRHS